MQRKPTRRKTQAVISLSIVGLIFNFYERLWLYLIVKS